MIGKGRDDAALRVGYAWIASIFVFMRSEGVRRMRLDIGDFGVHRLR